MTPALAAAAAWAAYHFLPTVPEMALTWPPTRLEGVPDWKHPYPVLLYAIGLGSLFATVTQLLWPSQNWVRHYCPLIAGATVVMCFWNLVTAKLDWLPQPYFPGPNEVL